ncbi:hypothetical protein GCM10010433_66410 [Streptomyces pulveraceus]
MRTVTPARLEGPWFSVRTRTASPASHNTTCPWCDTSASGTIATARPADAADAAGSTDTADATDAAGAATATAPAPSTAVPDNTTTEATTEATTKAVAEAAAEAVAEVARAALRVATMPRRYRSPRIIPICRPIRRAPPLIQPLAPA